MNTPHTPKFVTSPTPTDALLAHYQDKRARCRLAIRHLVAKFKSWFPRKYYRLVPVIVPAKFSAIDPGCPDVSLFGRKDGRAIGDVHWILSSLCDKKSGQRKPNSLVRYSTTDNPPFVICFESMSTPMSEEEDYAKCAREAILEINALVNQYHALSKSFFTVLDAAAVLECPNHAHLLGESKHQSPLINYTVGRASAHFQPEQ